MADRPSHDVPPRILLVEDDLEQAHLVKFLLEDAIGCVVILAQDGLSGALRVREGGWDLLITDLNLPGADGTTVVEASRRHQPGTPVLATTAYTGPEYGERALRVGADDVLIKPLETGDFLARVRALLSRPRAGAADGSDHSGAQRDYEAQSPLPRTELRVLAVSVRPGDAEVGCGATLLDHRERGDRVTLLTLTHGADGAAGERRREQAKAAGRAMGIRFFVGNAGSGDVPLAEGLEGLIRGALAEIRPDLVYIPTLHHPEHPLQVAHRAVIDGDAASAVILAYDPGDATPDFRPDLVVPAAASLAEKLKVVRLFGGAEGRRLAPDLVEPTAIFWGRHGTGEPCEPMELIRGDPSAVLGGLTLLPARDIALE